MGRRPVRRGEAEPLKIGLMTVFESPVLSLEDQAIALEASAEAFNARGGANGSCIEVTTCDDGGNADQARGLRANDRRGRRRRHGERPGHRRPGRRVARPWPTAGIPRVASNVTSRGLGRPERLPARRLRHRRHLPPAPGAHRGGRQRDRPHPGRPGRRLRARRASSRTSTRARRDVPLRRPGPGGHHRLQPVHPRRPGRRRRRRRPSPSASRRRSRSCGPASS